jgi:hypothetical protein
LTRRTTVDHQMIELDGTTVTLYDAEWYGCQLLHFDSIDKAEQCYGDTIVILAEAHNKLTQAGWNQSENWKYMAPEETDSETRLPD